jgi:hypothetical protein
MQTLGTRHLSALTALKRLKVLDVSNVDWAEDAISSGATMLAASLPLLRVLDAPHHVLVRLCGLQSQDTSLKSGSRAVVIGI